MSVRSSQALGDVVDVLSGLSLLQDPVDGRSGKTYREFAPRQYASGHLDQRSKYSTGFENPRGHVDLHRYRHQPFVNALLRSQLDEPARADAIEELLDVPVDRGHEATLLDGDLIEQSPPQRGLESAGALYSIIPEFDSFLVPFSKLRVPQERPEDVDEAGQTNRPISS